MQINGQRVPSAEGEVREVALDVIPADLLESIEVTKALTPDMWGDSIGGTVNLVTAQAPEKDRFFVSAAGGYNSIESGGASGRFTGMWAGRFAEDNKAGLVLSGSYFNTDRGSENFEVEYDDGEIDDLQYRDYTVNRERWGLNAAFDYRLPGDGIFYVRGLYNNFADQEYRRRKRNRVGDDSIERELKDRLETQEIAAVSLGGRNALGGVLQVVTRDPPPEHQFGFDAGFGNHGQQEFGFSDGILQMWATYLQELDGQEVPFGCFTAEESRLSHALQTAALQSQKSQTVEPV
jgi:outer membrane receptor protein involved in Fe transport